MINFIITMIATAIGAYIGACLAYRQYIKRRSHDLWNELRKLGAFDYYQNH